MRAFTFAKRTAKEILRDPLTLAFGLGFPVVLLLLLSAIQANIPVPLLEIETLAPGMTVFGLSFMTLFSATLIAKDRETALLQRLYATPMTGLDFVLGYMLPMLPIAFAQGLCCFLVGALLGLKLTVNTLVAALFVLPISLFFIAMGLLLGSLLNQKQVGGICGALLTNLTAWFSGIWFDLDMVGGTFRDIANLLPFVHGVKLEQAAAAGDLAAGMVHLPWVLCYGLAATVLAVAVFLKKMRAG